MIGEPINLAEFMKRPEVNYSIDRPGRTYESPSTTYSSKVHYQIKSSARYN